VDRKRELSRKKIVKKERKRREKSEIKKEMK
jgi:hypothetical protein